MSYLVLARKWRPQSFDEVVGQQHVTRTLTNAIRQDRVAHAFIFSGVRGVGKTSLARILAKSLNCATGPTANPCGTCDSCRAIAASTAVDVIEIDGASNNSVDDIRQLRETVPYRPVLGKYKIYVIDEVHMLSISAFNALLKTLEEPPPHVKFIFATTLPHKVPVTILSRCQRYDFRRIPTGAIVKRISTILEQENIQADEAALHLIGREAEGSMRDALSILDQILAAGAEKITAEGVSELLGMVASQVFVDLSHAVLNQDPKRTVRIVREVESQGYDIPTFAKGLLEHIGNLVVAGVCQGDRSVLDLPDQEAEALFDQAKRVSTDTLHRLFKHFAEAYEAIARSAHPRILLETALARLADLGELVPANELLLRLEALESNSGPTPPRSGNPPDAAGYREKRKVRPTPPPADPKQAREESAQVNPAPDSRSSLTGRWDGVVNTLKKETPTLASILEYGAPRERSGENGRGLTIAFSKDHAAIASLGREREGEIAAAVSAVFGERIDVAVQIEDGAQVPKVTKDRLEREALAREREEEARQHPLVKKLQTELGGAVQDVRLNKR